MNVAVLVWLTLFGVVCDSKEQYTPMFWLHVSLLGLVRRTGPSINHITKLLKEHLIEISLQKNTQKADHWK